MTKRTITVAALLALSAGAVGCSSGGDNDAAPSTTEASTDATASSSLEGTWRTAPVSATDAEEILDREGLAEWIDEFRSLAPFEGETVLVLQIGEEWDLYGESADGTRAEIDYDASYEVEGDEVVVTHSNGSNTFRWGIEGDALTLDHIGTTMPAYEGVPEEIFQVALYTTARFTREA